MTYLGFPVKMKQDFRKTIRQWWLVALFIILGLAIFITLQLFPRPFMLALVKTIAVGQEPLGIALSPDTFTVYVANAQGRTVSVIDTQSQAIIKTIAVNSHGRLNSVIVSSDGKNLYVSDAKSGRVEVFSLPDGQKIYTIPVRLFPQGMAFSKDNKYLYVVNSASDNVSVIDTTTHKLVTNIQVNERPYAIVVAPDGKQAYVTSSQTHSLTIIDTKQQKAVDNIIIEAISRLTNIVISSDGRYLYISDAISNSIVEVDTTIKAQTRTLRAAKFKDQKMEFSPTGLALSQDGKLLYAVGRSGYISVINLEHGNVLISLEVGKDLRNIVLTPEGTAYITSFTTNSVSVVQ